MPLTHRCIEDPPGDVLAGTLALTRQESLVHDFTILLEFDSSVVFFRTLPDALQGWSRPGYSPDGVPSILACRLENGQRQYTLYAIHTRSELHHAWPILRRKFRIMIHDARCQGWRFKILTEREIRIPRLENAKFLLSCIRRGSMDPTMAVLIEASLRGRNRCTVKQLLDAICPDSEDQQQLFLPTIWYLLGIRRMGTDFEQPLSLMSLVWLPAP